MQLHKSRNGTAGLATFVFTAYLGVCLARFAFFPANMAVSLVMVFIGASALILCWKNFPEQFARLLVLPVLLIFGIILSAEMTGRWERIVHGIVFVMVGYGISFLVIHERINSKAVGVVFGCCALYFARHMLEGDLAKNVFSHMSYNGISIIMLVCCISLYIVRSMDSKKITIFPAFVTYIVCSYGVGRGGIVPSAFLLIGVSVILLSEDRAFLKFIALITVPVVHLCYLAAPFLHFDIPNLFDLIGATPVFSESISTAHLRSLTPEPRLFIMSNYLSSLDMFRLLFGVDVNADAWIGSAAIGYSYHNVFITLHSKTGFVALVFYGLIFFALLVYLRSHWLYFVLLVAAMLRWFFDDGMFFESFDYLFYFFVLYAITLVHPVKGRSPSAGMQARPESPGRS